MEERIYGRNYTGIWIDEYHYQSHDPGCTCHMGHPPCGRCTDPRNNPDTGWEYWRAFNCECEASWGCKHDTDWVEGVRLEHKRQREVELENSRPVGWGEFG